MRKPNGWWGISDQDLSAMNHIFIPPHSGVPNPHWLLISIAIVIHLCSGFNIPVGKCSQFFAFTWKHRNTPGQSCCRESQRVFHHFHKPIGYSGWQRVLCISPSLRYGDNFILCLPSMETIIYLLKLLALKGHKVPQKLQFAETQYSGGHRPCGETLWTSGHWKSNLEILEWSW